MEATYIEHPEAIIVAQDGYGKAAVADIGTGELLEYKSKENAVAEYLNNVRLGGAKKSDLKCFHVETKNNGTVSGFKIFGRVFFSIDDKVFSAPLVESDGEYKANDMDIIIHDGNEGIHVSGERVEEHKGISGLNSPILVTSDVKVVYRGSLVATVSHDKMGIRVKMEKDTFDSKGEYKRISDAISSAMWSIGRPSLS